MKMAALGWVFLTYQSMEQLVMVIFASDDITEILLKVALKP
jgi:hypothetical protein